MKRFLTILLALCIVSAMPTWAEEEAIPSFTEDGLIEHADANVSVTDVEGCSIESPVEEISVELDGNETFELPQEEQAKSIVSDAIEPDMYVLGQDKSIRMGDRTLSSDELEQQDFQEETWNWNHETQTLTLMGFSGMANIQRDVTVVLASETVNECQLWINSSSARITGGGALIGSIVGWCGTLYIDQCAYIQGKIDGSGHVTISDTTLISDGDFSTGGDFSIVDSYVVIDCWVQCHNTNITNSVLLTGNIEAGKKLTVKSSIVITDFYSGKDGVSIDSSSALFINDGVEAYALKKDATLAQSFTLPAVPLKIPKGRKLTIKKGNTLYFTGDLIKKGKISGTYVIVKDPTALKITGYDSMVVGSTQQLKLNMTPADATPDVLWVSSDETLAPVDQNGKVSITKAASSHIGEQVIIGAISLVNTECYDEFAITIAPGTESIAIQRHGEDVTFLELWLDPANREVLLDVLISPADAPHHVAWKTDNAKIVSVSSNGTISAKKYGTATIWAEATDGTGVTSKKIIVKVLKAPSSVRVTKKLNLSYDPIKGEGTSGNLNPVLSRGSASTLTYSGYDTGVVEVDENGIVTAVGPGSTKITVKTYNKKKATCTVTVTNPYAPTGIKLDKKSTIRLKVGETVRLNAELTPSTAIDTVKWTTSKASVATVEDGLVTAVKKGSATITVTTSNGKKTKVSVKVSN